MSANSIKADFYICHGLCNLQLKKTRKVENFATYNTACIESCDILNMLCGKSLVKEFCFTNSFFISQILAHFYEHRNIITYMCVMMLLIYVVVLYFICFRNKNKYM